jgi:hypothetical protein
MSSVQCEIRDSAARLVIDRPQAGNALQGQDVDELAGHVRACLRDPAVRLAAYGVLISIVPFLLLEQTTVADRPDGDLGVIAMMALVLLFMASLRFALGEFSVLLSRRREPGPTAPLPVRTMVLGGFLGIMLCAGVIDVLGAAGVLPEW